MTSTTRRFTAKVDSPMMWLSPSTEIIPRAAPSWMPTMSSTISTVKIDR
ncbi:Uncharacterised protein [Mycobacteroides abscessus subsp. abscessus]|nr:Uncharacterised protein [Mycobacteroides abscessus subsp. abscessus]